MHTHVTTRLNHLLTTPRVNKYLKKGWKSIFSNQIRLGKPQYKVEEHSWGLVHIIIHSTYHNILCTIQLLNSPSKRSSYFETMFWQQATKATAVNSPCLTYFFLNFSWFNKQLGNEKHNYSTSMFLEVHLWRLLLELIC